MTKIQVKHPFTVRLEGEASLLAFTQGEHELDEDVLQHWFVQACLRDGRAVLLAQSPHAEEAKQEPELTETALLALPNIKLAKMAEERTLDVPPKANKATLVALLLGHTLPGEGA